MYRFMNYKTAALAASLLLTACGQSGALQLPNDPNYDKRAKYLLYSDAEKPQKAEEKQRTGSGSAACRRGIITSSAIP